MSRNKLLQNSWKNHQRKKSSYKKQNRQIKGDDENSVQSEFSKKLNIITTNKLIKKISNFKMYTKEEKQEFIKQLLEAKLELDKKIKLNSEINFIMKENFDNPRFKQEFDAILQQYIISTTTTYEYLYDILQISARMTIIFLYTYVFGFKPPVGFATNYKDYSFSS